MLYTPVSLDITLAKTVEPHSQSARRSKERCLHIWHLGHAKTLWKLTSDVYIFWGMQSWFNKLIISIVCFEIEYILESQFKNVDVMVTQASSSGIY